MTERVLFNKDEMLENMDNDTEFMESILEDSMVALVSYLDNLQALFARDDRGGIHILAHTMKGVAANISAPALRDVCLKIEDASHGGDFETAREQLPELAEVITLTVAAIKNSVR